MQYKENKIQVKKGDITNIKVDAIVNPANSYGLMGGGVALSIKEKGGADIEKEAISKAPIPVGEAIATTAGKLKAKYVIHAPTMEEPAQPSNIRAIKKATLAALKKASELKISSIAFPGMGTGVGRVPKDKAAQAMIEAVKESPEEIEKILFIAYNQEMYEAFKNAMKNLLSRGELI
ncbi:MAG: macro domain-containing protein [Methanothermobacter sp.]|nr:macro domain-containing protein [Methanothermobacter sp.]